MELNRALQRAAGICIALLLVGCGIVPKVTPPSGEENRTRKLTVFFDGTAQDERGETSIKKLHSLATLQDRGDIAAIYIEGVGAKGKPLGLVTGYGTAERVRHAYAFLLEHYRQEAPQEIYLFGFSRGAYAARILATMLEYAGLPNYRSSNPAAIPAYMDIASATYNEVFRDPDAAWTMARAHPAQRAEAIAKVLKSWGAHGGIGSRVEVTAMGLFDTVDEVGVPGIDGSVADVNPRFFSQMCNVRRAYHAVSLDDNREKVFAPKLITRPQLYQRCPERLENLDASVHEVWFSGAHSDVGGGYHDSLLGGVPLNWMLRQMASFHLFPAGVRVRENHLDASRDAEKSTIPWLYPRHDRQLAVYIDPDNELHNPGRLSLPRAARVPRIHQSVFDRMKECAQGKCAQFHDSSFSDPAKVWQSGHAKHEFKWSFQWKAVGCFAAAGKDHQGLQVLLAAPDTCGFRVEEAGWGLQTSLETQTRPPSASP